MCVETKYISPVWTFKLGMYFKDLSESRASFKKNTGLLTRNICRLIQSCGCSIQQLGCQEDPSITCCLFAIEPVESNTLDSNHVQLWETCRREGVIVSVWEREGADEGRRRRKGGGGTRCMCFSESVLSTGLIVNKCLVLEQQAPLSSVAFCCWEIYKLCLPYRTKRNMLFLKSLLLRGEINIIVLLMLVNAKCSFILFAYTFSELQTVYICLKCQFQCSIEQY